jgi:TolA-binding protein
MTLTRLLLPALLLFPPLAFSASREIQELQRDVALIQEQLRQLQNSQNEKLAALQVLVQQSVDAANKANTTVAVLESGIRQSLREQEKSVVAPVVGVGAKIDQMTTDFSALRESVADLVGRMGKLQQQIIDLSNAVKTMQAPVAPPPVPGEPAAGGAPPLPAGTLYQNAMRDRSGGKLELSLQQFEDYLKYYGNTDLAPDAQFYIAEIHRQQGDLEKALQEFDLVLEKYPDNSKTADALYMKGRTLVQLGRRTQGAQEFRSLIKRFPRSDLANSACGQLKTMGLSCGAPSRTPARRKK